MRLPGKQAKLYRSASAGFSPTVLSSDTTHSAMRDVHCAAPLPARGSTQALADGAFDLDNSKAYFQWRTRKLERYPPTAKALLVEVNDPCKLTPAEREAIIQRCRKTNMAIYACPPAKAADKHAVRRLGEQLGLCRLDANLYADTNSITSIRVTSTGRQGEYIPYSNQVLKWHTDGYYNPPDQRILAFIIHCVQDAVSGGENALLDPEIVYLLMRDHDPSHIAALMQSDVMTIPANIEQGKEIRRAQTGSVFALDAATRTLHMRYTARKHNIEWKNDSPTQAAVRFLEGLLESDNRYTFRHRLEPGQGIVCNNVLHNRSAFINDAGHERLFYRARYYDRIVGTWPMTEDTSAMA